MAVINALVSICIPVYNGVPFLRQAINSALAQTHSNIEIIIVDDGSSDLSLEIIEEYKNLDDRIRTYKNIKNLGLVGNWNKCVSLARGEWVKFVFQDDFIAPTCVETLLRCAIMSDTPKKAAFCRREFIFESADPKDYSTLGNDLIPALSINQSYCLWKVFPDSRSFGINEVGNMIVEWPNVNLFGEPTSFLIHRSLFSELGDFDSDFIQLCDLEYWLRIAVHYEIAMTPETLAYFRVHGKSTTNRNRGNRWFEIRYLERLKLWSKFLESPKYENLRDLWKTWPKKYYLESQRTIYSRRARIEAKSIEGIYDAYPHLNDWNNFQTAIQKLKMPVIAAKYWLAKSSIRRNKYRAGAQYKTNDDHL